MEIYILEVVSNNQNKCSHANQNKCCHCGHEGESKHDFTVPDPLFLGAYLASLPGVISEASFSCLQISDLCAPIRNCSQRGSVLMLQG